MQFLGYIYFFVLEIRRIVKDHRWKADREKYKGREYGHERGIEKGIS